MNTKTLKTPNNKTPRRNPIRGEFELVAAGRVRFHGPRWLCERKAKGYSPAAQAHVRPEKPFFGGAYAEANV